MSYCVFSASVSGEDTHHLHQTALEKICLSSLAGRDRSGKNCDGAVYVCVLHWPAEMTEEKTVSSRPGLTLRPGRDHRGKKLCLLVQKTQFFSVCLPKYHINLIVIQFKFKIVAYAGKFKFKIAAYTGRARKKVFRRLT